MPEKYIAFVDESHVTASRYRSLSAVSLRVEDESMLRDKLQSILNKYGVSELKWQNLKKNSIQKAAFAGTSEIINAAVNKNLRVDTLIWDTYDSRHNIKGRDDNANFERMVYHLLHNVINRRPKNSTWNISVDQKTGVDWQMAKECLATKGNRIMYNEDLFEQNCIDKQYDIENFTQVNSKDEPFVQISDIFSGLAVYSVQNYDSYCNWLHKQTPSLFEEDLNAELSNNDKKRSEFLHWFSRMCKDHRLYVSLKSERRLVTKKPKKPINFWHYTPQVIEDKAPTKKNK
jgi:hypothetical protein